MKIIAVIVFVCALGLATATTEKWTQIRVKFAFSGILNNLDSFWKIQNTLNDTLAAKWVIVNSTNDLGLTTACITQADVRVCPLYDQKGFIAGMQLAIPPTDVEGKGIPYDFRNFTVFEKKLINGVEYWTSIYLVVNPVTLKSGGRTNMTTLGDGLWLKNGTSYTEVPTDEKTIATTTPYIKQNCLPNMGTHYYYNITNSTECAQFQPYFLLTKNGSINGLGWQFFGRTRPVTRNWYDSINRHAVQITVPLANACLADWTDKYGVISIRMYFVNNPWDINCDQKTESAVPITGFKGAVLDTLYLLSDIAASTKRMFFG